MSDPFVHYMVSVAVGLAIFREMKWNRVSKGAMPFILGIFALMPDVDIFIGLEHRNSIFHSVIGPLVLFIGAIFISAFMSFKKTTKRKGELVGTGSEIIGAVGIYWLLHLVLDMDRWAINVFYPFGSPQVYAIPIPFFPPYDEFLNPGLIVLLAFVFIYWVVLSKKQDGTRLRKLLKGS